MVYTISDAVAQAFTVAPVAYTIGDTVRASLGEKAWPMMTDLIPVDAEKFFLYADQDVWVYFLSSDLLLGQVLGTYTPLPALPAPHFVPTTTPREYEMKAALLYIVRDTADGTLYLSAMA